MWTSFFIHLTQDDGVLHQPEWRNQWIGPAKGYCLKCNQQPAMKAHRLGPCFHQWSEAG